MASPPLRRRRRPALGVALAAALALSAGCGDDSAYCARAQRAFDEIDRLGQDAAARGDAQVGLQKLKAAFAGLDDGAPDEVRDDVRTMTGYVAGLHDGGQLEGPEPPEVQAAGDRFSAWLGRSCDPGV
jgi:hypothetical protein